MVPIMAILALGQAAYNYSSANKAEKGAHAEGQKVPRSNIPQSAYTGLAMAENMSKGQSAESEIATQGVKEAAATAASRSERAASSGAQVQSSIASAQTGESKSIRQIQGQESANKEKRKLYYIDRLFQMAGLEQQTEDSNKANAYNVEAAIKEQSKQRKSSAVNQMFNVGMMAAGSIADGEGDTDTTADTGETTTDLNVDNIASYDNQTSLQAYQKSGSDMAYPEWVKQQKEGMSGWNIFWNNVKSKQMAYMSGGANNK